MQFSSARTDRRVAAPRSRPAWQNRGGPAVGRADFAMPIGQILVEHRWVTPAALARALAEQRHTGQRICSLLISRGLLDPDNAVRALANQHNVPGVLQRHLENRDHALAASIPAAIAHAWCALPIGRTRNHELIVCVRDPSPEVRAAIAAAVAGPVVIAVAPASQLEQLVASSYPVAPAPSDSAAAGEDSVDVDLSTRQIATISDAALASADHGGAVEVDLGTRPIEVFAGGLGELGSMTLVGLDDDRVAKDPSQSGQLATLLPRTWTAPHAAPVAATAPPRSPTPPRTVTPLPPRGMTPLPPRTVTPLPPRTVTPLPPRTVTPPGPIAPTDLPRSPAPATWAEPPPASVTPPPRTVIPPPPPVGLSPRPVAPPLRTAVALPRIPGPLPRIPAPLSRPADAPPVWPRTAGPDRAAGGYEAEPPAGPSDATDDGAAPTATDPALAAALAAIARASDREAATDAAMRYLGQRFHHTVVFAIHENAALGDRGHGGQLTAEVIQSITIPLSAPSIVQAAHDTRRLVTEVPPDAGVIQDRLARALGQPTQLAALPIEIDARVAYVIAVGDAPGAPAMRSDELEQLGGVLEAAYHRLAERPRRPSRPSSR
jgi:hypothetical protein